jgi:DNA-binding NarL/FixJ family response regulator
VIRVLIADDQALVRGGFRMILEAHDDIEVCAEAADGREALRAAETTRPDVVLMDIRMPELDGVEATRRLLAGRRERPRVLVVTTFDLDEYVYEAMRAGASGFLLKDTDPPELVRAVRVVSAGEALLAPSITRRLIEQYTRRPAPGGRTPERLAELTDRELDVLRLLARGLSNAEIAAALFLSPATVKTHVARILMKLDLRDRVQAVVLAYETGVVTPGEDPDQVSRAAGPRR